MSINKADLLDSEDPSRGVELRVPCFTQVDEQKLRHQLDQDRFFWLDLNDPSEEDVVALADIFQFHPLALEDVRNFRQRPKLDDYGDYAFLVFYGAPPRGRGRRSAQRGAPVHLGSLPDLDPPRGAAGPRRAAQQIEGRVMHSEQFLIYRILDALTDSFFPVLSSIDDEIDELTDALIAHPTNEQLQRIFALKRDLVSMRKVVTPQRDIFARSIDQLADLPGLTVDERDYFRDVYDHLIRISDLIDSYRDLLSGATDVYLSTVANRQNEVMKQLAVIATIFLPLTFITGFFGQNFAWLVTHVIRGEADFFILGIGSLVVSCVVLAIYFKRKGWM